MADWMIRNANLEGVPTDIAVEGGRIAALGTALPQTAAHTYDAAGRMVIPGFVDCHTHLDKSLLNERAPYEEGTGAQKGALTRGEKAKFTVEDITQRAERVIRRALASGTVALRTNVDVDAIVGLQGIEALLALREQYRDRITIRVAAFAQ